MLDCILSDQWEDEGEYVSPSLAVSPAVGQWQDEDILLSLKTPELGDFESMGEKSSLLYQCEGFKLMLPDRSEGVEVDSCLAWDRP